MRLHIPVNYENEREFINSLSNAGLIEQWEDALKNNPEKFYRNIYLKLELDLNVSAEPDASSPKTHMPP